MVDTSLVDTSVVDTSGAMTVRFFGVRGSTPSPGAEFVEVGGHTSCVGVFAGEEAGTPAHDGSDGASDDGSDGSRDPRLVLDAGTGLQALSRSMDHRPFQGTILLTHLHWDHVQGLPFFRAGDQPGSSVRLVMPAQGDPVEVLRRGMSPPHFPIGPDGLQGSWTFDALESGPTEVEGFAVTAADVPHKGGRTFGYRIEGGAGSDRRSFAYLPDHRPDGSSGALDLCRDVDVLIHDAQFVASEVGLAEEYGHSTIDEAVAFASACGAGGLVLFHHGPARTDDQIRSIVSSLTDSPVPVTLATEGLELTI